MPILRRRSRIDALHLGIISLLIVAFAGCHAPPKKTPTPPSSLSSSQQLANLESFDYIWNQVKKTHWDPELGGVDWDGLREKLRPKVAAAKSMNSARRHMRKLVDSLNQSHFAIIPAQASDSPAAQTEEKPKNSDATISAKNVDSAKENPHVDEAASTNPHGSLGIKLRLIDGFPTITHITANSLAPQKEIQLGWRILKVDDIDLLDSLKPIRKKHSQDPALEAYLVSYMRHRLEGPIGEQARLKLEDGDGQIHELEVPYTKEPGTRTKFGHMPEITVTFEKKLLDHNIGYIAFSMFMDPQFLLKNFSEAVQEFMGTAGIIIDLRGNPGGMGGLVMGMSGWFFEESGLSLGTMKMRRGEMNFLVFPRVENFSGPLAILIDGSSGSTSEIWAQGLKDLQRAHVFGSRSCGAALPSMFEKLPNGDRFQYPIADYISSAGTRIEGVGVEPNTSVLLQRKDLLNGRDTVVDAAVNWLIESATER